VVRGLSNWTYTDVTAFLKDHDFVFLENRKGSHEAWVCKATGAVVGVYFHGNKTLFPEGTLESMIRQSKISKTEWRKWAAS